MSEEKIDAYTVYATTDYVDEQLNSASSSKLISHVLPIEATEENQTIFPINLETFDAANDTILVQDGITLLLPNSGFIIENNTIVMTTPWGLGDTGSILILKNTPILADEVAISGAVIENNSITLDKLSADITTELDEIKKSASDGKALVAGAITDKGIETATDAAFETMANNINSIITLDSVPSLEAAEITPGTSDQVIGAGNYLRGDQTIKGDENLIAGNIKSGVELFGVVGNLVAVGNSGATIGALDFSTLASGDTTTLKHNVFGDIVFEVTGHDVDGEGITTLVSKNAITTKAWNSTGANYSASSVRSWLNGEFYNGFDSAIKASIQPVSKITGKYGDNNISLNEPETTTEYCWLLSEAEVGVSQWRTQISEGSAYSIFSDNTSRIKYLENTAISWWLRSPSTDSSARNALAVYTSGAVINGYAGDVSAELGIVVGICVKTKPEGNSLELATSADMLVGKGAYDADGSVIEGGIPSKAAATITPGVSAQTIAAGQYLAGAQTIAGDANLVAGNIAKGKSIFGVTGIYDPVTVYSSSETIEADTGDTISMSGSPKLIFLRFHKYSKTLADASNMCTAMLIPNETNIQFFAFQGTVADNSGSGVLAYNTQYALKTADAKNTAFINCGSKSIDISGTQARVRVYIVY